MLLCKCMDVLELFVVDDDEDVRLVVRLDDEDAHQLLLRQRFHLELEAVHRAVTSEQLPGDQEAGVGGAVKRLLQSADHGIGVGGLGSGKRQQGNCQQQCGSPADQV